MKFMNSEEKIKSNLLEAIVGNIFEGYLKHFE